MKHVYPRTSFRVFCAYEDHKPGARHLNKITPDIAKAVSRRLGCGLSFTFTQQGLKFKPEGKGIDQAKFRVYRV